MLVNAFVRAVLHHPRLGIGEIKLISIVRPRFRRLGFRSARFLMSLASFVIPLFQFSLIFGLFGLKSLFRPLFNYPFSFRQLRQPFLTNGQFIRDVQFYRQEHFLLISLFAQFDQFLHFPAQLTLYFKQPLITDRIALGCIGMDLTAMWFRLQNHQY